MFISESISVFVVCSTERVIFQELTKDGLTRKGNRIKGRRKRLGVYQWKIECTDCT